MDSIELIVQVNGLLRDRITVANSATEDVIFDIAANAVQTWIADKELKKRIYVPGKLVNFVVS